MSPLAPTPRVVFFIFWGTNAPRNYPADFRNPPSKTPSHNQAFMGSTSREREGGHSRPFSPQPRAPPAGAPSRRSPHPIPADLRLAQHHGPQPLPVEPLVALRAQVAGVEAAQRLREVSEFLLVDIAVAQRPLQQPPAPQEPHVQQQRPEIAGPRPQVRAQRRVERGVAAVRGRPGHGHQPQAADADPAALPQPQQPQDVALGAGAAGARRELPQRRPRRHRRAFQRLQVRHGAGQGGRDAQDAQGSRSGRGTAPGSGRGFAERGGIILEQRPAPAAEAGVPQTPPESAAPPARRRRRRRRRRHHRRRLRAGTQRSGGTKAAGLRGGRDADGVTQDGRNHRGARGSAAAHARSGPARFKRSARNGAPGQREEKMGTADAAPLEELEELSQELLRELSSGCTEELLRRGLERRERLETRLLETQGKARDIAKDLAEAEAKVFQRLQDVQADVQRLRGRSQELDTELERARGTLSSAKDKTQALRLALEELQEQLRQLEQHKEDKEDPSLPPDAYVAQVYYEISRIDWDCSAGPGRIRGIHYGPDIAVPLDMDEEQHSGTFISDYLWGLVPTEWRPRRPPVLPREPLSP